MEWVRCRRVREVAAILALAGMAFYVALLPWHLTSQLVIRLAAADLGASTAVVCHSASGSIVVDLSVPGDPSGAPASASNCPICKGLSGLHAATLPAAPDVVLEHKSGPSVVAVPDRRATDAQALAPRSRGPPSLA